MVFDWDDANVNHIRRHQVTPDEAEQAVSISTVDVTRQFYAGEERFMQVGCTARMRILVVVTTWRGDLIRVVTAYPAPAALQQFYWKERNESYGGE